MVVVAQPWVSNPFLGAIRGGTGGCSSLTLWHVQGVGWFCMWAVDLVEIRGGCTSGETFLLTWLFGVSRGSAWLFLPDLVEGLAIAGVCCRTVVVAACSPFVASSVSCECERLYSELRVAFLQVLGFSFTRCLVLEGLSMRQIVTITWDPQPRASMSDGVAPGGGRAQVTNLEQKGKNGGDSG
ncbi:hypothetical protein Taro_019558, partial [Colocasia esculenta]|nr:hypothetical protein [Colocasia esculenta]